MPQTRPNTWQSVSAGVQPETVDLPSPLFNSSDTVCPMTSAFAQLRTACPWDLIHGISRAGVPSSVEHGNPHRHDKHAGPPISRGIRSVCILVCPRNTQRFFQPDNPAATIRDRFNYRYRRDQPDVPGPGASQRSESATRDGRYPRSMHIRGGMGYAVHVYGLRGG